LIHTHKHTHTKFDFSVSALSPNHTLFYKYTINILDMKGVRTQTKAYRRTFFTASNRDTYNSKIFFLTSDRSEI
jgi:hypothetical protein